MPKPKKESKPKVRYSIGEWYGLGFEKLTPEQRIDFATREVRTDKLVGELCPFMGKTCNKRGGVCSIRAYQEENGAVEIVGPPVAVCPNRFKEDKLVQSTVGNVILKTVEPRVLGEIGFLNRFKKPSPHAEAEAVVQEEGDQDSDFIGRIDNVLVHPTANPMDWCALEVQAVYFSGNSMGKEFKDIASSAGEIRFPVANRRPDFRSSGPKRLLPQLQTKVPYISNWGKKMVVVVDEPFFESLIGLTAEPHLSNSQIVWFVMGYEETATGWKLCHSRTVPTQLQPSVIALTGGTPLSREQFENQLAEKLEKLAAKTQKSESLPGLF